MATGKSSQNSIEIRAVEMQAKIMAFLLAEIRQSSLNTTQIANRVGMPASTISRILQGKRGKEPKFLTILKIYYSLDIPAERLARVFLS